MIDVLRMEKFLLLCRRFLGASLERVKEAKWKGVEEMMSLLEEIPLNVLDHRLPNGLRYHVIDIFVDEVEKAGVLELDEEMRDELLEKLLGPLKNLAKDSPTKTVRSKAKEALADERLPGNEKVEVAAKEGEEDGDVWGGFDD